MDQAKKLGSNVELFYFDLTKNKKTTKSMICGLLSGIGSPFRRGTRIRTWDPLVPNQVRYRTALHPDDFCFCDKNLASFKSVAKVP